MSTAFRVVRLGRYFYRLPLAEPKQPTTMANIVGWLRSGRWVCACGRAHRAYLLLCACGRRRPGGQS